MGICPRCGSWVDEGEPYCSECCYGGSDRTDKVNPVHDSDRIDVNGSDYDKGDVEDALDELGYDFDDLKLGFVDEDELEEILEDM
ncbi:hypothetical protein [uncultured Methanobrevibacter sp.]|uniref:hypothetical protein n=1 Tax=uncultured Methanobrevibacter sp. TaxID=253161 RepID=UPI0025D8964E|nr:hypothetical protein [uncultured Methanobrevibacter sp.]